MILFIPLIPVLAQQIRQFWRGKHRIKSKMEIDPATQGDAGIYECHANNKYQLTLHLPFMYPFPQAQ